MNLTKLASLDLSKLTPTEVIELNSEFDGNDAMHGLKLGIALTLQEEGISPSEFEAMILSQPMEKVAFMQAAESGIDAWGKMVLGGLALGSLGGGYSGYLRHRAEKAIEGKDDPELVEKENKIRAYREMLEDIKRTKNVSAA